MQIEPLDETSVGVDGRVCFYGKTSHYHVDLCEDDRDENEITGNTGSGEPQNNIQRKSTPSTIYATPDQNLVARRAAIPELLSEITPTVLDHLLDAYWCWAHHLHLVLNKGLFLSMYCKVRYQVAWLMPCRRSICCWPVGDAIFGQRSARSSRAIFHKSRCTIARNSFRRSSVAAAAGRYR